MSDISTQHDANEEPTVYVDFCVIDGRLKAILTKNINRDWSFAFGL